MPTTRASKSSYIALSGIWFALALGYALLAMQKRNHALWETSSLFLAVGLLWAAWLRGFLLKFEDDRVVYRDGFYRTHTGRLSQILTLRTESVQWSRLPATIRVSRIVVEFSSGQIICINPKPFSHSTLSAFRQRLEASVAGRRSLPQTDPSVSGVSFEIGLRYGADPSSA